MAMLSVFWTPLPPFCIAGLYLLICGCWTLGAMEKDTRTRRAEIDSVTAALECLLIPAAPGDVFESIVCVDNRVYVTLRVRILRGRT